jgi:hypothetical protein
MGVIAAMSVVLADALATQNRHGRLTAVFGPEMFGAAVGPPR